MGLSRIITKHRVDSRTTLYVLRDTRERAVHTIRFTISPLKWEITAGTPRVNSYWHSLSHKEAQDKMSRWLA